MKRFLFTVVALLLSPTVMFASAHFDSYRIVLSTDPAHPTTIAAYDPDIRSTVISNTNAKAVLIDDCVDYQNATTVFSVSATTGTGRLGAGLSMTLDEPDKSYNGGVCGATIDSSAQTIDVFRFRP